MQSLDVDTRREWHWLYRVAGSAALGSAALIFVAGAVLMTWPPPPFEATAANTRQWFAYFESRPLAGLFNLDLVMVVDNVLAVPIFVALYIALRRVSQSWALMGLALALVGVAGYFAVNPAFSMLSVSQQYATGGEAERAAALAAGQAALATYRGTGFDLYLVLVSTAGVIFSAMMVRAKAFGRVAGSCGIASNVLNPGMFIPGIGLYIGLLALLPLLAWFVLVARTLLKLSGAAPEEGDATGLVTRELVASRSTEYEMENATELGSAAR
jgi:hypothetical protein